MNGLRPNTKLSKFISNILGQKVKNLSTEKKKLNKKNCTQCWWYFKSSSTHLTNRKQYTTIYTIFIQHIKVYTECETALVCFSKLREKIYRKCKKIHIMYRQLTLFKTYIDEYQNKSEKILVEVMRKKKKTCMLSKAYIRYFTSAFVFLVVHSQYNSKFISSAEGNEKWREKKWNCLSWKEVFG